MNIATEPKIAGKPIVEQPRKRPVRMVRWFIIVGLLLAALVGGFVWFNYFRGQMIAQFFANNRPPPTSVSISEAISPPCIRSTSLPTSRAASPTSCSPPAPA
jgi:multidrug efflux system membrane fusion protein